MSKREAKGAGKPLIFEAAFRGFTCSDDFQVILKLEVPPQCSSVITDNARRFEGKTFIVTINGLEQGAIRD